jgi:hypothetical protein
MLDHGLTREEFAAALFRVGLLCVLAAFAVAVAAGGFSCSPMPKPPVPAPSPLMAPAAGWPLPGWMGVAGAPGGAPAPAALGTEAAKRSIATWATWIGRMGYFTVAAGILLGIFSALRGGLSWVDRSAWRRSGRLPLRPVLPARPWLLRFGVDLMGADAGALRRDGDRRSGCSGTGSGSGARGSSSPRSGRPRRRGRGCPREDADPPEGPEQDRRRLDRLRGGPAPVATFSPSLFARHNLPIPKSGG